MPGINENLYVPEFLAQLSIDTKQKLAANSHNVPVLRQKVACDSTQTDQLLDAFVPLSVLLDLEKKIRQAPEWQNFIDWYVEDFYPYSVGADRHRSQCSTHSGSCRRCVVTI